MPKIFCRLLRDAGKRFSIDTLDRTTAFQLIDHADMRDKTDENGHKSRSIQVKCSFVDALR